MKSTLNRYLDFAIEEMKYEEWLQRGETRKNIRDFYWYSVFGEGDVFVSQRPNWRYYMLNTWYVGYTSHYVMLCLIICLKTASHYKHKIRLDIQSNPECEYIIVFKLNGMIDLPTVWDKALKGLEVWGITASCTAGIGYRPSYLRANMPEEGKFWDRISYKISYEEKSFYES